MWRRYVKGLYTVLSFHSPRGVGQDTFDRRVRRVWVALLRVVGTGIQAWVGIRMDDGASTECNYMAMCGSATNTDKNNNQHEYRIPHNTSHYNSI